MHQGQSPGGSIYDLGQTGGETSVSLLSFEVPQHTHNLQASARSADLNNPSPSNALARSTPGMIYKQPAGAKRTAADGQRHPDPIGRQPAAQQPDALSDAQLLHRPAGRLPAPHMTMDVTPGLRPAGPGDAEVLYQIYASTREEELAVVPWDAPTKEAFLRMQFAAQDTDCQRDPRLRMVRVANLASSHSEYAAHTPSSPVCAASITAAAAPNTAVVIRPARAR